MTVTDVRTILQSVVAAHATHNTFYSIWSSVKDRETELSYPCVVWDQWRSRLEEDDMGYLRRAVLVRLLIITSVPTDRTPEQRDAAVEAADNAAADFILKIQQDYRDLEISNVSSTTQFDEYTALETGVLLTFTLRGEGLCLDEDHFEPIDCPTFEELIVSLSWAQIKEDMSPEQIAAAEEDLGEDCDPTTVNGVESATPTITVLQGGEQVGSFNPATGVVTVEECPPCENVVVQLKDSAGNNIGAPDSYAPGSSNTKTAPDGTATALNSASTNVGSVSVRSNGSATINVGDSVITRPDGTTVGLPATVSLDVRSYQSGIVYQFGNALWSGQTTQYATGDEAAVHAAGWFNVTRPVYPVRYAELTDWITMNGNNVHGNTIRFTDRTGAAAATSGDRIIQDHLTGLEWYLVDGGPTAANWANSLTAIAGLSVGGNNDWIMPPENVLETIIQSLGGNLNYGPFLIDYNVWSSSTSANNTASARSYTTSGVTTSTTKATATGQRWIAVRKFM